MTWFYDRNMVTTIPTEMWLEIASYLKKSSDFAHLARTSKTLAYLVGPQLYQSVDFKPSLFHGSFKAGQRQLLVYEEIYTNPPPFGSPPSTFLSPPMSDTKLNVPQTIDLLSKSVKPERHKDHHKAHLPLRRSP
jgi:hypothetical protein